MSNDIWPDPAFEGWEGEKMSETVETIWELRKDNFYIEVFSAPKGIFVNLCKYMDDDRCIDMILTLDEVRYVVDMMNKAMDAGKSFPSEPE